MEPTVESEQPAQKPLPRWRRRALWGGLLLALVMLVTWGLLRSSQAPPKASQPGGAQVADAGPIVLPKQRLVGERTLEGSVLDDLKQPLSEAQIRVTSLDDANALPWETSSDKQGHFKVERLVAHALSLEVTRAGHDGTERTLRADDNAPLTFVLSRQGELLVVLRDTPGHPVAGTVVTVTGPGLWPAAEVTANAAGEALFTKLAFGEYRARARREGRVGLPSEKVRVVPGARALLTMTLVEGAELRARVIDRSTRAPIAAAQVAVFDPTPGISPLVASSDDKGELLLRGLLPQELRLEVTHAGHAPRSLDSKLPLVGALVIELDGEASVSGNVVDESGRPVSDALLSVSTRDGLPVNLQSASTAMLHTGELGVTRGPVPKIPITFSVELSLGTLASQSDAQGAFRIAGLAPTPVVLSAAHAGYAASSVQLTDLVPHGERRDVRIVLRAAGRVEGSIHDLSGRALTGVYVSARAADGMELSAISDQGGRFALLDVLGELTVSAEAQGYTPLTCHVTVVAGSAERCDMTVGSTLYELPVRVVDEYRFGLEGVVVSVAAQTGARTEPRAARSSRLYTQVTRRDGSAVVRDLPEPPYQVEAALHGFVTATAEVTHAERELRITLQRAASLAGTVTDALGHPVAGAMVSTDEGDATGETDGRGGFLLTGVTPGALTLLAAHTSVGEGRSAEVRARAGETLEGVRVVLPGRGMGASTSTSTSTRVKGVEFELEMRGRSVVFVDVLGSGGVAKAGVHSGDVLLSVDGEQVLSPAQGRGMLRDPAGLAANLRLTRDGAQLRIRYKRPGL